MLLILGIVGSIAFVLQCGAAAASLRDIGYGVSSPARLSRNGVCTGTSPKSRPRSKAAASRRAAPRSRILSAATPQELDAAGVARAAIESLAENFSDAIVAPVLWMVIGGLPGAALYKAINTADSMIGHRTPRHADFGWAAARLDDLVNLPASRLSALLLVAAAALNGDGSAAAAWRAVRRDAARHRSPNAGYPEAAMAGALGLSLAGPRVL